MKKSNNNSQQRNENITSQLLKYKQIARFLNPFPEDLIRRNCIGRMTLSREFKITMTENIFSVFLISIFLSGLSQIPPPAPL